MRRLIAVLCAFAVALGAGAWYVASSPSEAEARRAFVDSPFYVFPQPVEINDLDVLSELIEVRVSQGDNPRLLMGSSELTRRDPCSSHPTHFFGEHNYGFDTISIGDAGFQSLWQAMEVGALKHLDAVPGNKVALIVGMQWFFGDGCSSEAFLNSFSEDAYRACMANSSISEETKRAITERASQLGKDRESLERSSSKFFPDRIDAEVDELFGSSEKLEELRQAVSDNTPIPEGRFDPASEPDWDALIELSVAEGESACTTNDIGVFDEYYETYIMPWLEETKDMPIPEPTAEWSQKELGDFKLYLQVCKETGIEPLIIIMPVKGMYYDRSIHSYESRQIYYDMIRSTCEQYGVEYADYSEYEYDTYFMRDVMHFGWTGWAHVDQALYEFFGGEAS
ncbi:D-alanyl-lipoteichoic acid biosynthesis protein DltD [Arabiibacter massiliensis]|uniref:D-alanyl-lipoteichoic acid biosynthesis protein DltD n=1 Tax=Arabiibacter massiliensis TaxID=1870985 RepID=UPI0009BA85CC|nr:D-alanyl-lipoteichoic acid biosynthesis protein DltD [Arabiibacter massiliensis]